MPGGMPKSVINPIEQARHYAHQVVDALKRDPQLVRRGQRRGQARLPLELRRRLHAHHPPAVRGGRACTDAIEPHRVICSDEMTEAADPEEFQSRLWGMFPTLDARRALAAADRPRALDPVSRRCGSRRRSASFDDQNAEARACPTSCA